MVVGQLYLYLQQQLRAATEVLPPKIISARTGFCAGRIFHPSPIPVMVSDRKAHTTRSQIILKSTPYSLKKQFFHRETHQHTHTHMYRGQKKIGALFCKFQNRFRREAHRHTHTYTHTRTHTECKWFFGALFCGLTAEGWRKKGLHELRVVFRK